MKRFYHIDFLLIMSFAVFSATSIAQVSGNKSALADKSISADNGKSGSDRKEKPDIGSGSEAGYALQFDGITDYVQAGVFTTATSNLPRVLGEMGWSDGG